MDQNLEDISNVGRYCAQSLQAMWDSYTCVLRPPGMHPNYRPMRMPRADTHKRLYTLGHLQGFDVTASDPIVERGPDIEGQALTMKTLRALKAAMAMLDSCATRECEALARVHVGIDVQFRLRFRGRNAGRRGPTT